MPINEKDIKKISLILLFLALTTLVFIILKPVFIAVASGLLLAYIFFPVYKWLLKYVKFPTLSAAFVSVIVILIIILPVWILLPIIMQQIFDFFIEAQSLDIHGFLANILPGTQDQLISQIAITANSAITSISSKALNSLVDFIINFPIISLHIFLAAFVFFFTLKDQQKLREFASGLSPFNMTQERALVKQFKDMTQSIIFGQVIIGILQGVLAGIGFLIFGVPNALLLTLLAIILSIIPIIGPSLVYGPMAIYLVLTGDPNIALLFLLYNVIIVSSIDNLLRAHIVSKRTKISQVIILVGMIGGLFVFGILGLILGPLILAYFLTFLRAYKTNQISSMF